MANCHDASNHCNLFFFSVNFPLTVKNTLYLLTEFYSDIRIYLESLNKMSENKKVIPMTQPYKVLGTFITLALFIFITFSIYNWLQTILIDMAGNSYISGEYSNTYFYLMMAIFAESYQLLILGGGIFMGIILAWSSVEDIGLDENKKVGARKPLSDMIWGFLYPIGVAIVMLPIYGVLSLLISFGHAQQLIETMAPVSLSDAISLHITTLGAFLVLMYIIYLVGLMPANAISLFIVSLVSVPYLRRELRRIEKPTSKILEERILHQQVNLAQPSAAPIEGDDTPIHELLNPEPNNES